MFSPCVAFEEGSNVARFPFGQGETLNEVLDLFLVESLGKTGSLLADSLFVTAYHSAPQGDRYSGTAASAASGLSILPQYVMGRYWHLDTVDPDGETLYDVCLNASTLSDEQVSDAVLVYRNRHTAGRWVPNDTQVELKNGTPYACDTGLSLSGDFTIAGGNISQLATPALIAPANESNVGELIPRLQWAPVGGAAQYQVQVSVTPTFTILEMNIAGLANTEFDTNLSEPFVPYFWRVRGQDSDGTWGPWSEPWVFVATNVLVDTEDEAELPDTFVLD